jgi:group I intron endonuclease
MIAFYLISNRVNGKQYLGLTKQRLQRRWRGHIHSANAGSKSAIHAAIRKYGKEAFDFVQIASCLTGKSASRVEIDLIEQYGTKAPKGYNLTDGGDGVVGLPREIIERTAAANRGRTHTAEARKRIGEAARGRRQSDEGRAAISAARKGKQLSLEHREKLSRAKIGKKLEPRSAEHSAKISAGLVRAHARRRANSDGGLL